MAHVGQQITNPGMGVRLVFRQTNASTKGELVEFDCFLAAGRAIAKPHLHPRQEESIEVVAGQMRGVVGGEARLARTGDVHVTPAGVVHHWSNDGDNEAHLLVRFRPALHAECLFEHIFSWAEAGHANKEGLPSVLRLAVLLDAYPDEFYPAGPPLPVVKGAVRVLAPVGRLLGYGAALSSARRDDS